MSRPGPPSPPTPTLWLSMALSLAAVLPLLGLPVYFRTDDVHWLGWAIGHDNPLAALEPGQNLFGYYRPVPTVIWWALYRLFRFEPLGYQLVLGAVGVLAMVPLFRIGRRVAGGQWGGLAAVALFHLAFVNILYFYFWYSALTFALEVLLILLSLDAFFDGPARPGRPWRFLALALLAGLAKQPALLVIPAVTLPELLRRSDRPGPGRIWAAGIGLAAIALMAVTPFVAHRPEALGRMSPGQFLDFATERWLFYAGVLLRGPGGPLAAGAALLTLIGPKPRGRLLLPGVFLAAAAVTAILARLAPGLLFPAWLLLLAAAAWRVPASRGWFLAFLIPLLALMGVDFHVSTYLLEPALMLTVAMLCWLTPFLSSWAPAFVSLADRVPPPARLAGAPLLALLGVLLLHDRVGPIVAMRDVRALFRTAVESVLADAPPATTLGYLSYEEIGESYADIRQKPLSRRVEQHKTMNGAQLAKFLRLRGRPDLRVATTGEADTTAGPVWYLAVNSGERRDFAARGDLTEFRAWSRRNEAAALFRRHGR